MDSNKIKEKIQQRRIQMLTHSYLYEKLDSPIISDYQWDMWAKELAELQNKYPELAKEVVYADVFDGWTGDTASGLVYDDRTVGRAYRLLRYCESKGWI